MDKYNSIGICAGSMMFKWKLLDDHIHKHPIKLLPGDKVNIFINMESILGNLVLRKDLPELVHHHKQKVVLDLESAVLNLIANYKMYFRKEKCQPKIFLYYTEIKENKQQMSVYNEYYRSYYQNRFNQNPQYKSMGDLLNNTIIPELKILLSYIKDCYFIESKIFDASIIPFVCSRIEDGKNIIITGDIFDTLYMFNPNFAVIYIKRFYSNFNVISDIHHAIRSIIKEGNPFDMRIFEIQMYYQLLLAIKGSKIRNIRSAKGFGYSRFMKILKDGIDKDLVLKDFESINSILPLIPEKYQQDLKTAFQCTDLGIHCNLITDADADNVKSQIVDKIDNASVESLNNKRFLEFPINLSALIE